MNSVKIVAIVRDKCTTKSVGFKTDPPLSEEVVKLAQQSIPSRISLSLNLEEGVVVVKGPVFPASHTLAGSTAELLSKALDSINLEERRKEAELNNLAGQYATAAGNLPIV